MVLTEKRKNKRVLLKSRKPSNVLDKDLKIVIASRSFYEVFNLNSKETVGQLIKLLPVEIFEVLEIKKEIGAVAS